MLVLVQKCAISEVNTRLSTGPKCSNQNPYADFEFEKACFRDIKNSHNVISLETGTTSGIDLRPSSRHFLHHEDQLDTLF